jgi:hypothetical protein
VCTTEDDLRALLLQNPWWLGEKNATRTHLWPHTRTHEHTRAHIHTHTHTRARTHISKQKHLTLSFSLSRTNGDTHQPVSRPDPRPLRTYQ